jgi:hypothetical protein
MFVARIEEPSTDRRRAHPELGGQINLLLATFEAFGNLLEVLFVDGLGVSPIRHLTTCIVWFSCRFCK